MPAVVESMTPTPTSNSQGVVMEGSTTSGTDKKRNKLGYHRTSVACVHCRRRKIRCLVAADDAHGRCENCIRLRKECQYLSVDQQPPIEKKSRPNSRVGPMSTEHSAPTASPSAMGGATEGRESFFSYQPMPLSSNHEMPTLPAGNFAGNPIPPFTPDRNVGPAEFVAAPSIDPWDEFTTISDPQLLASMNAQKPQMMNIPPNVWNPGGAPVAPIPSNSPMPATPSAPQSQTMNTAPGFAMQPDGSVWPIQPARSLTYPPQPEMASPYSAQFPPHGLPDLKQRMATPGQPLPGGPINPQSPLPPDMHAPQVPVSYPGQQPMDFPAYQDMSTMPAMNVVPYSMFSGDATQQSGFAGQPPMGHAGHGHHSSGP